MLLAESWKAKARIMMATKYQIMKEKLPRARLNGWVLVKLRWSWFRFGRRKALN